MMRFRMIAAPRGTSYHESEAGTAADFAAVSCSSALQVEQAFAARRYDRIMVRIILKRVTALSA